ncbi:MAG: ADP-ribosylation factor-like protein [Candidatus Hodarchaeales archaeon]|jgi:GTPase SAR1 family protein
MLIEICGELRMFKILLLGLPNAGKTAIFHETYFSVVKDEENPFNKIIFLIKSLQNVFNVEFHEENSIVDLSENKLKELFLGSQIIIWVVDVSDQRTLSTSLFHWKKALTTSKKYSKFATKYISFHKTDLLDTKNYNDLLDSLREDFQSSEIKGQLKFYNTSLKDESALVMMSEVMKQVHESSFEIKQIENQIEQFLQTNSEDFFGATLLSTDGLPVIEFGTASKLEFVVLPANLWLGTNDRLKEAFNTKSISSTIHLSDQILIFFDIGSELLLTTIAKKEAPLQFSFIRSDLLAQSLREILNLSSNTQ